MTNENTDRRGTTVDRRDMLKAGALAAAGLLGSWPAPRSQARTPETARASGTASRPTRRPNVVVICSDDHRADLMSCTGHSIIRTPNLDRLAQEGAVFENAFATTGVCSPSRGGILTGKYAFQAAAPYIIWTNNSFRATQTPFPSHLHAAGYHAAHIGKWHLGRGDRAMPGYDHWAGFVWLGEYFDTHITVNGAMKRYDGFSDDILSEMAAVHIAHAAREDQPFCLFIGLKAPHLDFQYPPRHARAFDDAKIPKPPSFDEDYAVSGRLPELKNTLDVKTFHGAIPKFGSWENYVKSYYRSTLAIDDAVGRVLDALDGQGCADDTLVLYTSDQGYTLGEHGLTEKHFCHEEAMRVPMLMRYPRGIRAGQHRTEMMLNIDIAPTILDVCTGAVPHEMTGRSAWPLLTNDKPAGDWRDDFLFETISFGDEIPGQVAVRTERHKLITYPWLSRPFVELYDLQRDPLEMRNVADEPRYAAARTALEKRLARLKRENQWALVEKTSADTLWVLDPVPTADRDAVRTQLLREPFFDPRRNVAQVGQQAYRWHRHEQTGTGIAGKHMLADLLADASDRTAFVAIVLERLVDYDPFVLVTFAPIVPMRGYVNGRLYNDSPGAHQPPELLESIFNPPLLARQNIFLLEFPVQPSLQVHLHMPRGTVRLRRSF